MRAVCECVCMRECVGETGEKWAIIRKSTLKIEKIGYWNFACNTTIFRYEIQFCIFLDDFFSFVLEFYLLKSNFRKKITSG